MKTSDRQKMCPNCDGRIAHDANQCPYCFANLPAPVDAPSGSLFSLQDSLYSPPYRTATPAEEKKAAPAKAASESLAAAVAAEKGQEIQAAHDTKGFWPILMLTAGANLFTLGILQFFFSDEGLVKLEMSSGFWFLFVLLSLPLFYFGLRQADRLK